MRTMGPAGRPSIWPFKIGGTTSLPDAHMYADQIRTILAEHGRLAVDVTTLSDDSDLYEAGLTSLSTVNLMLALEERFDVEFLDRMLGRKTFGSIRALNDAIEELRGGVPLAAAPSALEARGAA